MFKNIIVSALAAAIVAALVAVALVGGNSQPVPLSGSSDSGYNATADGVYAVDGTTVIDGSGNIDAPVTSTTGSFSGLLTTNAGNLKSYTNSTSTTATSYTAVQADLLNYDSILIRPNTGDLTITLPATSTLTSMVPSVGDRQDFCLHNSTTTAGIDITIAAGTGIDLETASSTPTDLTILADQFACFSFIRKANTDVGVLMTEFTNGD
jgi:hypothetical protein